MKHYWQYVFGIALLMVIGAFAKNVWAQSNSEVIQVCIDNKSYFRLVQNQTECKKGEKYLMWNVQGIPGPQGEVGPQGPQGEPGSVSGSNSPELCQGCAFEGNNFSGANFHNAVLEYSNFTLVDLSGADLSGANLRMAGFSESNLSGAILVGAILDGTGISMDTNLEGTQFGETDYDVIYYNGGPTRFEEAGAIFSVRCPIIDPEGGLTGHWEPTPDHHDCTYIEP